MKCFFCPNELKENMTGALHCNLCAYGNRQTVKGKIVKITLLYKDYFISIYPIIKMFNIWSRKNGHIIEIDMPELNSVQNTIHFTNRCLALKAFL